MSAVLAMLLALLVLALPGTGQAAPAFPELTGRVVDQANILPEDVKAQIDGLLAAHEAESSDQVVVVTIASLEDYDIADYGYQLGRHWGIGQKQINNGVLLIVAPNERKLRIEVGYGLEANITDGLASSIIRNVIVPQFKAGDMPAGILAGTQEIITLLKASPEELAARKAEADGQTENSAGGDDVFAAVIIIFIIVVIVLVVISSNGGGRGGGRRMRSSGGAGPIVVFGPSDFGGGGGFGGGFGGGGGGFGGGGASGGW